MLLGQLVRRSVKAAALPLGVASHARTGDLVMLLYHRVGVGAREIDLEVDTFDRHLAYLADRRAAVTLDEALDGGGGVVVTVDDGYRDFHAHVLPLLVTHGVPALLYLATGLVGDGSEDGDTDEALSWSQLSEAVSTGLVSVGSHTHGHVDLSRMSEAAAEEEMRRSKELIEDRLGVACRHLAYPWGVASPGAERAARRRFRSAALGWATNRGENIDPYRLGRTPVLRSDGQIFFRAKVGGILDAEALAYRALRRGPWRRR